MSIFKSLLEKAFLIEITLTDHFEKFIKPKYPSLSFDDYQSIAELDPTTRNDQRGKYVEWILKTIFANHEPWLKDIPYFLRQNMFVSDSKVKTALEKYVSQQQKPDINTFKSFQELYAYTDTLSGFSKKQQKREEKSLLNDPDNIKVIDETDEWIVIETLTREGNIKGAQWKTNPQANWCTAYLDRDNYWEQYHRGGDLLQFINKKDPYEKYQIFIKNETIDESRDYKDNSDNTPRTLIDKGEFPNFDANYGKLKEREPFKYVWDEEGAAYHLLSENGYENDMDYLNRHPDDDEYDYYYEEASRNEVFQINHWDRFLRYLKDIYIDESDRKYSEVKDRITNVPFYFSNPITGDQADAGDAKDAIYEMYDDIEDEWDTYASQVDDDEPKREDYKDEYAFKDAWNDWRDQDIQNFRSENKVLEFAEYFLDEFPYDFKFKTNMENYQHNNEDEQLKFNFGESIFGKTLNKILQEDSFDDTFPTEDEVDEDQSFRSFDETFPTDEEAPVETPTEEPKSFDETFPTDDEEEDDSLTTVQSTRLLYLDRKNINKDLKDLLAEPKPVFPLTAINGIINKYGFIVVDDNNAPVEIKLKGLDGNVDYNLGTTDDKSVSNSVLVVYHHKNDDSTYNFNVYCS